MAASDPNLVSLGAPAFINAGHAALGLGGNTALGNIAQSTFNTDTGLTIPQIQLPFDTQLYLVAGEVQPLLTLMRNRPMTQRESHGNVYWWTLDRPMPEATTATGCVQVGGATIALTYAAMFTTWDTIWVPAAGNAYGVVNAMPTITNPATGAGTVPVTWFTGLAPTVAITAQMSVIKLGNTHREFHGIVPKPHTQRVQAYNIFQEFIWAREMSDRFRSDNNVLWIKPQFGGTLEGYEREKQHREALVEEEKTAWFGQASWNAAGAVDGTGTLEGVYQTANALRTNLGGAALTLPIFEDWLEHSVRHRENVANLGEPVIFTSPSVIAQISRLYQGLIRVTPGEQKFGIRMGKYISPYRAKEYTIVELPLLTALPGDAQFSFEGMCIMLRMEPDAVCFVRNRLHSELTYRLLTGPQSFGLSWVNEDWRHRWTIMIKDQPGHVSILDNIAPSASFFAPPGL